LRSPDDSELQLQPLGQCGVDKIDEALNRLTQAAPQIKKNLLDACVHVIGADGSIVECRRNCSARFPIRSIVRCRRLLKLINHELTNFVAIHLRAYWLLPFNSWIL